MKKPLLSRKFTIQLAILLLGLVTYCLGVKFLLFPAVIFFMVSTFVFPSIFESVLAKIFSSFIVFYGIHQITATVQQFAFSELKFTGAAVCTSLIISLLGFIFSQRLTSKTRINSHLINSYDIAAILAVMMFVIPFSAYLIKGDIYQNIALLGGIQAVDGINHWNLMASNSYSESMSYSLQNYFPAGFHLTSAFLLDSFGMNIARLESWKLGSLIYAAQYVIVSSVFILTSIYFVFSFIGKRLSMWQKVSVATALTPAFILFFIIPFIYNGFLNHFYICSAAIMSLIYLNQWVRSSSLDTPSISKAEGTFSLYIYYCVAFGAATSWPLVAPPFILAPILVILSKYDINRDNIKQIAKALPPIIVGSALLSVPILFQALISPTDPASSILLDGGLKTWHVGVFIVGIIALAYGGIRSQEIRKRAGFISFIGSFLILILGLALFQYFLLGEVRYYTIKTSSIVEVIILLLITGLIIVKVAEAKTTMLVSVLLPALVVPVSMVLALSINDNPLKEARSLFRDYSNEEKPPFFNEDVSDLIAPAVKNKTELVNYMTLHYAEDSGKVFAHAQVPFWINSIDKNIRQADEASACLFKSYNILLFGNYTDSSQAELIRNINKCAELAQANRVKYYIYTDRESLRPLRTVFPGSNIEVTD